MAALRRWSRCRWRCRRPPGCRAMAAPKVDVVVEPLDVGQVELDAALLELLGELRGRQAVGIGEDDVEHRRHRADLAQPVDQLGERRPRPGPLAERVDRGLVDVDDDHRRAGGRARRACAGRLSKTRKVSRSSAGRCSAPKVRTAKSTARPTIQTARPRRRAGLRRRRFRAQRLRAAAQSSGDVFADEDAGRAPGAVIDDDEVAHDAVARVSDRR